MLSGVCRVLLVFFGCVKKKKKFVFFFFLVQLIVFPPNPGEIRNHWEFTSDYHRFILPYCKVQSYKEEEQVFAVLVFG